MTEQIILKLPFQPPLQHMLAKAIDAIPEGEEWSYEPKWDGFRALIFFDGEQIYLQSRDLKPLGRYFPELEASLRDALPTPMILDGEIVIATDHGLDFDALQMRIHPAASRVKMLSEQTPSSFVAFDLLATGDADLRELPFSERRERLLASLKGIEAPIQITPETRDRDLAQDWFERFEGAGLDGVIAKRREEPYRAGRRDWLKIKHLRTVDCVVGGFRWNRGLEGDSVGSLLLGLYDADGVFHHVGHTSSFKAAEKRELVSFLAPYVTDDGEEGFGRGRTPGEPSRWTGARDMAWVRLRPELVCEVTFDYLQGPYRFRHAATFRRWRTDKPPTSCTFDQIATTPPYELQQIFGA
ncbi:MAG: ATP-dependent DNA ligase [Dehalococcoidia bacterium]|nr:ATP-dependent DNA ligase [Dehalococcoidia bacterium]